MAADWLALDIVTDYAGYMNPLPCGNTLRQTSDVYHHSPLPSKMTADCLDVFSCDNVIVIDIDPSIYRDFSYDYFPIYFGIVCLTFVAIPVPLKY